jgi:hypothetical protein
MHIEKKVRTTTTKYTYWCDMAGCEKPCTERKHQCDNCRRDMCPEHRVQYDDGTDYYYYYLYRVLGHDRTPTPHGVA